MAESKKKASSHQEGQQQHLEQINQQLQTYLLAQQKQQLKLQEQLRKLQQDDKATDGLPSDLAEPVRPSNELADYLYAQGLLEQHRQQFGNDAPAATAAPPAPARAVPTPVPAGNQLAELYADGMQEIFGNQAQPAVPIAKTAQPPTQQSQTTWHNPLEINALKIAYSKLPMALRNRKFGRPSFHAHTDSAKPAPTEPEPATT
jgi:hypothetical protein